MQQDRLNYEAVVQYAGIADNDLLYFSYTNQVSRVSRSTGARPNMLSSRTCHSWHAGAASASVHSGGGDHDTTISVMVFNT